MQRIVGSGAHGRLWRVGAMVMAAALVSPAHAAVEPRDNSDASRVPLPRIEYADQPLDEDSVTIGFGIAVAPSYEGSDDYVLAPGGMLRGRVGGFGFQTRGTQLQVNIVRRRGRGAVGQGSGQISGQGWRFEAGPIIGVNLNRVTAIRDARVRALGRLPLAVEGGGFIGIVHTGVVTSPYDFFAARLAVVADIGSAHNGAVFTPSIDYGTPLSETSFVGLSVSADIVTDNYARTYFGVSPAGALASGLAPFTPDGGVKDISVGATTVVALKGDLRQGLALVGTGSYSRLIGDFAKSPVVADAGDADQWFGALGLAYTF